MNTNTDNINGEIEVPDDESLILDDAAATPPPAADGAPPPADGNGPDGDGGDGQPPAGQQDGADGQPPPEGETDEQRQQRRAKKRATLLERVNTLTRERRTAEETAAAALARKELLEEENQRLREQLAAKLTETLAEREAKAIAKRDLASEEHDLKAFAEAQDELAAIRSERDRQTAPPPRQEPPPQPEPKSEGMHPAAVSWLERNEWFTKPENAVLVEEVVRLQNQMLRQGKQLSDEFYQQIDEILAERPEFDAVRGVQVDDEPPPPPPPADERRPAPRMPGMPPVREGTPPPASTARPGALTEHDKSTMRRFGLDPNNPKHRENYLKHKAK